MYQEVVMHEPQCADKRNQKLYLDDGNIVLIAYGKTGDRVLFRLHKSILAQNSPVFKDMFSIPSPSVTELYDGVPLVCLHDDPEDLEQFLTFLYNPSAIPYYRHHADTPLHVKGPLRLAVKYQADVLRNRILSHLADDWPSMLSEWDALVERTYESGTTGNGFMNPANVISLAREHNIPSLRPMAFYEMSVHNDAWLSEHHSGFVHEDLVYLGRLRETLTNHIQKFGGTVESWICSDEDPCQVLQLIS